MSEPDLELYSVFDRVYQSLTLNGYFGPARRLNWLDRRHPIQCLFEQCEDYRGSLPALNFYYSCFASSLYFNIALSIILLSHNPAVANPEACQAKQQPLEARIPEVRILEVVVRLGEGRIAVEED